MGIKYNTCTAVDRNINTIKKSSWYKSTSANRIPSQFKFRKCPESSKSQKKGDTKKITLSWDDVNFLKSIGCKVLTDNILIKQ